MDMSYIRYRDGVDWLGIRPTEILHFLVGLPAMVNTRRDLKMAGRECTAPPMDFCGRIRGQTTPKL